MRFVRSGLWMALLTSGLLWCGPLRAAEKVAGQGTEGRTIAGSGAVEGSFVRDTGELYENVFRDLSRGTKRPTKLGYGEGTLTPRLLVRPGFQVPLMNWSSRPEDAEIKIGRLYIDFRSVSASVLYSDNVFLDNTRREDGLIAVVGADASVIFQVNEGLRLSFGAKFVWLPFENAIGFGDVVGLAQFSEVPVAAAQLVYEIPIGGWEFILSDTFTIHSGGFREGEGFDFFEVGPVEEDRAGRYAFRTLPDRRGVSRSRDDMFRLFLRNTAGLEVTRLLPTVTRLTVSAHHINNWYGGDAQGQPRARDVINILLESERENLRFKPFASYTTHHSDTRPGWDQVIRGGVRGPITENMDFMGDVGYFIPANSTRERWLWTVRIAHTPDPDTRYIIRYLQTATEPALSIVEKLTFLIERRFGPDVSGEAIYERAQYDDLDNPGVTGSSSEEWRAGLRFNYDMSPRLTARLSGYFRELNYVNPALGGNDVWVGRLDVRLKTTETVDLIVTYMYTDWDSTARGRTYQENFVLVTLRKDF